jgi:arginine deiminase
MPKLRAAMHRDTVFAFADRDCVLIYPDIVNTILAFSYRPAATASGLDLGKVGKPFIDAVAEALGQKKMRVVETDGSAYLRGRTQWDSGADLVCASPGVFLPTTATPTPTPSCASKASRSSPYRAPNWPGSRWWAF